MGKILTAVALAYAGVLGAFADTSAEVKDWFDAGVESGFTDSTATKGGSWCAGASSLATYDSDAKTVNVYGDNLEFEANCARGLDAQVAVDMELAFEAYGEAMLPEIPVDCKGGVTVGYVVSGENDDTTNYYYYAVTKCEDTNGWVRTTASATVGACVRMKISYKVEDGTAWARYEIGADAESLTALTADGVTDGWFELAVAGEKEVSVVNYTGSGKVKHLSSLAEPLPALVVFGGVVTTPGKDLDGSTVTVALDEYEPYDENPTFTLKYGKKTVTGEVVTGEDGSKSVRFVIPDADAKAGDLLHAEVIAEGTAAYDGTTKYDAATSDISIAQGAATPNVVAGWINETAVEGLYGKTGTWDPAVTPADGKFALNDDTTFAANTPSPFGTYVKIGTTMNFYAPNDDTTGADIEGKAAIKVVTNPDTAEGASAYLFSVYDQASGDFVNTAFAAELDRDYCITTVIDFVTLTVSYEICGVGTAQAALADPESASDQVVEGVEFMGSGKVAKLYGEYDATVVDPSLAIDADGEKYTSLADAVANGTQPIRLLWPNVTLPEGWEAYEGTDGAFYLRPNNYVARIGEFRFATLERAFAAAAPGDVIVLCKDVMTAADVFYTLPAGVSLDLYDTEAVPAAAHAIVDSEGAFLGSVVSTNEGSAVILRNANVTVGDASVDALDAVLDAARAGNYVIAAAATANGVAFDPETAFAIRAGEAASDPVAVTVGAGKLSVAGDLTLQAAFGSPAGGVALEIPTDSLAVAGEAMIVLKPGDSVTTDGEVAGLVTDVTGYEVVETVTLPEDPVAPESGDEEEVPSAEMPSEEAGEESEATPTYVYTVEPIVYSITYRNLGGCVVSPTEYTVADTPITLAVPERTGYAFREWQDAEGKPVTGIAAGSATNLEFTAVWIQSSFKITYASAFGTPSVAGKTVAGTAGEDGYTYTLTADDLAVTVTGTDAITDWKFVGWDAKAGDVIANDVIISAVWKKTGFSVHVAERGPGVDFTNTTVKATLSYDELPDGFVKDGVTAKITYTRKSGATETVTGTITWDDATHSAVVEFERFDVDASQGGTVVIKTGEGAVLAENAGEILSAQMNRWITEHPGTDGVNYNVTGAWATEGFTPLADGFDVCDAHFTAKTPSQGAFVDIYSKMTFEGTTEYETLSDWSAMKAGIILVRGEGWTATAPVFNFAMLHNGDTWETNTTLHASASQTYTVHVILNYLNNTVRYSLMDTDEAGNETETILGVYANADVMTDAVRNVDYPGPGLLTQLDGDYWSSNVAKDTNGVEYATVDAAAAYGGVITLLWDATYNRGGKPIWHLVDAGKKLYVNGVSEQWQIPENTSGRILKVSTSAGDVDKIGPVFVSDAWLRARLGKDDPTDEEILAELNRTTSTASGENGLRVWQNYVLGTNDTASLVMNGKAATEVPTASARENAKADEFITLDSAALSDPNRKANEPVSGLKVSYQLQTSADHAVWANVGEPSDSPAITVDLANPDLATATYWRINIIYTER